MQKSKKIQLTVNRKINNRTHLEMTDDRMCKQTLK